MIEKIIAASAIATCYCARKIWLSLTVSPFRQFLSEADSVFRQSAPDICHFTPGISQPAPKRCDWDHNLLGLALYGYENWETRKSNLSRPGVLNESGSKVTRSLCQTA